MESGSVIGKIAIGYDAGTCGHVRTKMVQDMNVLIYVRPISGFFILRHDFSFEGLERTNLLKEEYEIRESLSMRNFHRIRNVPVRKHYQTIKRKGIENE